MPVSEAASVARAREERTSFAALYADRYAAMVRLAHLMTGSNAAAEELVQDAFVRVYERWEHVDHPSAYLRQAVVNACRSYRRRRLRERGRRPEASPSVSPEVDELWDALGTLTPRQRAVVVLRYYENLPENEIASLLQSRPGTV